jgi:guanylate kinase
MKTLFIITGRSGVGKTVNVRKLQEKYGDRLHEAVSVTTRQMRPNEVEGMDYKFVTREHFNNLIINNQLVENVEYNGNYYGLALTAFDPTKVNVAIVEPSGLRQIKEKMKKRFNIVIIKLEENDETLVDRLVKRGDAPEVREKRIYGDKSHFTNVPFDYLTNSKFEIIDTIVCHNSDLCIKN